MRRGAALGLSAAACTGLATVHLAPSLGRSLGIGERVVPRLAGRGLPHHVALTFDDGPDRESTPRFLAQLAALDVRATFFMLGREARDAPEVVTAVVEAGHEVAVHGDRHITMGRRLPRATAADIARGRDTLAEITGTEPTFFRPPYGMLTLAATLAARRLGLTPVLWTSWGRDWRPQATPSTIVADVLRHPLPGATVLLHDSDRHSARGCWRATLASLPRLDEAIRDRGLTAGPLRDHWAPLVVTRGDG